MRVALLFHEPDVDALKDAMDADQWAEWMEFSATEPSGWQGLELVARRLSFVIAQGKTRKKLDERKFAIKLKSPTPPDPKAERRRFEAAAIRSQVRARLDAKRKRVKNNG